jgi:hypothetical protein
MSRTHPTSGLFTPSVCDQLFNNTTELVKPVTHCKATSTTSPHNVSSSSSHSSRESRHAVESYRQTINLMHTLPPQQSTPSLTHHNPIHHSPQVSQPPQSMHSHPIHVTPTTQHNTPSFTTPNTPQSPYGSPISFSPGSHPSLPLSPLPPPGTTYHHQSPQYFTAHGTFDNTAFESSPVKQQQAHAVVRQLEQSYEQGLVTLSPDHIASQNSPA